MGHRTVMKTLAVMLLVGLVMGGTALAADTIKVGLVTHKTGALAVASKVTGLPNVELWVHKVNERGGLKVDAGSLQRAVLATSRSVASGRELGPGLQLR